MQRFDAWGQGGSYHSNSHVNFYPILLPMHCQCIAMIHFFVFLYAIAYLYLYLCIIHLIQSMGSFTHFFSGNYTKTNSATPASYIYGVVFNFFTFLFCASRVDFSQTHNDQDLPVRSSKSVVIFSNSSNNPTIWQQ